MAKKPLPRRRVTPKKRSQPTKSKPTPPADGRVNTMRELKDLQKEYGGVIRNVGKRDKPLTPPQQQEAKKLNKALSDAQARLKDLSNVKVRQGEQYTKRHADQVARARARVGDLQKQLKNIGRVREPGSTGRDKSGGYQVPKDFGSDPRPPEPKPRPPRPKKDVEAPRPEIRDDIPDPYMEKKKPKENRKPSPTFQKSRRFGGREYVTGLNPGYTGPATQATIKGTYKGKSGYYTDGSRNTFVVDGADMNKRSDQIKLADGQKYTFQKPGMVTNTNRDKTPDPTGGSRPAPQLANYQSAISKMNAAVDSSPLRAARDNKALDKQVSDILGGSSGVKSRGAFASGIRNVFK